MAHRDDRDAMRARADAAARDLADAREELERLAPEKERLEREAEALRTKLALIAPQDEQALTAPRQSPASKNLVSMSIALGALTMLLVVGLALAAILLRTTTATLSVPHAVAATPTAELPSPTEARQGEATGALESRHAAVLRLLATAGTADADPATIRAEVAPILGTLLDYDEVSRRTLGAHWEAATPAQRAEFAALLRQLVEGLYEANLTTIADYEVVYMGETPTAEGVVVRTAARSRTDPSQPPVRIAYSMRLVGTGWRVFDVDTDGVSLVRNYQRQFDRIITQEGWDALVDRMRRRLSGISAQR